MAPSSKKVGAPRNAPTTEEEKPKPEPGRKTTTIGELGHVLPVGVPSGGALDKTVSFFEWKTKKEREIGKDRKKNNERMGDQVNAVLANMVETVGPMNDFSEMKKPERILKMNQLYMADIFFMYVVVRIDALGPKLHFSKLTCANCEEPFNYSGDLNSVEVTTVESEDDLLWEYEMVKPVKLRGMDVKSVTLTSPRWTAVTGLRGGDENQAKIHAVRGSVVGFNGYDPTKIVQLTDPEIDEFYKIDLEGLSKGLDSRTVGPRMSIEGNCPACNEAFDQIVDWTYNNFFSVSSQ